MSEHREEHVARICIRQEKDYPNSPLDVHRPREEQGWWDITLNVLVRDDRLVEVAIEAIRKAP
jgi:hypothetical protein